MALTYSTDYFCRQHSLLYRKEALMRAPPHVIYAQAKYMWAQGERESSLNFLRQFATSLSSDVKTEPSRTGVPRPKYDEISRLLARCYFKQGQWEAELDSEWQSVSRLRDSQPSELTSHPL